MQCHRVEFTNSLNNVQAYLAIQQRVEKETQQIDCQPFWSSEFIELKCHQIGHERQMCKIEGPSDVQF